MTILVQTTIQAPLSRVWELWTDPEHIKNWNNASPDWHTPAASNDLRTGGKFTYTMAARDGSFSFDFGGTYTQVVNHEHIEYVLEDDRRVKVTFDSDGSTTTVVEEFEPEGENPEEMQRAGWQAILDNFKAYCEAHKG